MCLILFSFQPGSDYPLTVIANRDEFYARPSRRGHFWEDLPSVFGGRDLQAGGSWMAVERSGRFAAVTNYREDAQASENLISRGALISDFFAQSETPHDYLRDIEARGHRFAGFNLLVGDATEFWCYSNRESGLTRVEPGVHGLSNGSLNESWPKVDTGKASLAEAIERNASLEQLQAILLDETRGERDKLPDTGVGWEAEELLSSRFIRSDNYGTCTTTVMQIARNGVIDWREQYFDKDGASEKASQWHIA